MKTIHKYKLTAPKGNSFISETELPIGAEILCIGVQNNIPYIWAIIDTDNDVEIRELIILPNGIEIKEDLGKYISTIQIAVLVFHIFEGKREK
jgi:hypothetical protein